MQVDPEEFATVCARWDGGVLPRQEYAGQVLDLRNRYAGLRGERGLEELTALRGGGTASNYRGNMLPMMELAGGVERKAAAATRQEADEILRAGDADRT